MDWRIEGTGGNCTALIARDKRFDYFIVSREHICTAPERDDEPCTLGVWDGMDEKITEHATVTEAKAAAGRIQADAVADFLDRLDEPRVDDDDGYEYEAEDTTAAWERVDISTRADGSCTALVTSNDNDDDGYDDGQVEEWTRTFGSLDDALRAYYGGSHTGVSGIAVTVRVNGVEYRDGKPVVPVA